MEKQSVPAAFAEHGKWITRFVIDGVAYGGSFEAINDTRLDMFFAAFPNPATILELGCLEGGHTIALSRRPGVRRVVGVESRQDNLARAGLVTRLLKANNIEFVHADLETASLRQFGQFDAIFCSGLLYHLSEPWKLSAV
jgi:tRNA G46 methylase TrmB